ncbi:MAG: hypothetical protein VX435_02900 [Planctomycetota bacterium]|nr:hypothetical protein [Planctomycetota bacterium]
MALIDDKVSSVKYGGILLCALAVSCFFSSFGSNQQHRAAAGFQEEPRQGRIADWIWHNEPDKDQESVGIRFFRKGFELRRPQKVILDVTGDDHYEVYVNGDLVGSDNRVSSVEAFEITRRVRVGNNVISVKAGNKKGTSGLLVRILVTQRGGTQTAIRSDASWVSQESEEEGWNTLDFDDSHWKSVRVLDEDIPSAQLEWQSGINSRFQVPQGFVVEKVASAELTGSVVNMTFDEKGRILISREGKSIYRLDDADSDGLMDTVVDIAPQISNCHGLLALDGMLYAVGVGPEQTGLYRLKDGDEDGVMDEIETLGKTDGGIGEHGPHAILLGPDGWLYWALGNHAHVASAVESTSAFSHFYEGDALRPRYEDAGGHAIGVKVPGGTVIRLSRNDKNRKWYRVAGGFRNQFDIAFNTFGELFTFDSDMEYDVGLPWYRPVRVNHVTAGAEFGWRSGSAKWPSYYFDSLPAAANIGRGSPTGVVFYHHNQFPSKYSDAFFISDWAQGEILAVHLKRQGATWKGDAEVFATGNPLNVTDVEVGPDGALYFSCGGRSTEGGVFRIIHQSNTEVAEGAGIVKSAIQQPQPESAWGRHQLKHLRAQAGDTWSVQLGKLAADSNQDARSRVRALQLLQENGESVSERQLKKIAKDPSGELRAQIATLAGIVPSRAGYRMVAKFLMDVDPLVRRRACESIIRSQMPVDPSNIIPLLSDNDRFVRFAARRVLEKSPVYLWIVEVLNSNDLHVSASGMLALLTLQPDTSTLGRIIVSQRQLLEQVTPSHEGYLDLVRTIQLSGLQDSSRTGSDWDGIRELLLRHLSSGDSSINRELARTLAMLSEGKAVPKLIRLLGESESRKEQVHLALCLLYIPDGWNRESKHLLLRWFNKSVQWEGGYSFSRYIRNFTRDFLQQLDRGSQLALLADGVSLPMPAGLLVESFESSQAVDMVNGLLDLDQALDAVGDRTNAQSDLAKAVVAALGKVSTNQTRDRLRNRFKSDPDLRPAIIVALAEPVESMDQAIFLESLEFLTGDTLRLALSSLQKIDTLVEDPNEVRRVIIAGLKLGTEEQSLATGLLKNWFPDAVEPDSDQEPIAQWQDWFSVAYPDLPSASLPVSEIASRWQFDQLLEFLTDNPDGITGNVERGAVVFEKAQCIKCHRYGSIGEGIGPDLTTLRRRFRRKEILESIFYPSHVISDQYQSQTLVTRDGKVITGLVAPQGTDAIVVLDIEGKKTVIAKEEIEQQLPSKLSAMPEGLLNPLSMQQIADLFAQFDAIPVTDDESEIP